MARTPESKASNGDSALAPPASSGPSKEFVTTEKMPLVQQEVAKHSCTMARLKVGFLRDVNKSPSQGAF